ncbi:MAG: MerR family transcriptional regulator [Erysipelotrichaceae bacterium]|nr:MerR family transcriptional regulator [Erysipelotrichaceae bacterium]MDY5251931.1 MerR family transcriptional regulator [Erysipelotrichaceae bacterium]
MKINDLSKQIDLSKRAIKYYEEAGLLTVKRDENGYRDYSPANIKTLKEISVYRKLGLSIKEIKAILKNHDDKILLVALQKMEMELTSKENDVQALRTFIQDHDIDKVYAQLDYQNIAQAIQEAIPGFVGYYFINHFLPYLQIKIETQEQQQAYDNIIAYWDETNIHIPLLMRAMGYLLYKLMPKPSLDKMIQKMDQNIIYYTQMTPEKYAELKKQVLKGVKIKNNPLYKYGIAGFTQRRFMKELQNKGYNDIFIPNMIKLSPKYKEYHEALDKVNDQICADLGLYYDSNYQLVLKKKHN